MEQNKQWLEQRGVAVKDDVDVFDLAPFLQAQGLDPEDVGLCVFNCAHGRNYRDDATERYELEKGWGWQSSTFRAVAFQAMCAQLPSATCVVTTRRWEPLAPQLGTRPVLTVPAEYPEQSGPPYLPEPSTRFERRPGELGPPESLAAVVAVGPLLESALAATWTANIPALALQTSALGKHVLFLGEFTLAASRHCAQYACDREGQAAPAAPEQLRQLQAERRWHRKSRAWYSYADCLTYTRENKEAQPELLAANIWRQLVPKPQWQFAAAEPADTAGEPQPEAEPWMLVEEAEDKS